MKPGESEGRSSEGLWDSLECKMQPRHRWIISFTHIQPAAGAYAEQPIGTVPGEQDRERVRRGVRTSAKDSEPGEERSEHGTDWGITRMETSQCGRTALGVTILGAKNEKYEFDSEIVDGVWLERVGGWDKTSKNWEVKISEVKICHLCGCWNPPKT